MAVSELLISVRSVHMLTKLQCQTVHCTLVQIAHS